ncbi:hypothetical protein VP1G_10519 [Cytospora mali]|uniref:Uncharacterized protein n=1 Tax=Cytospora mali TaxID=578113 RepID=A0A194UNS2_CYTMA|nr:hypothetical protein VP1G_10519 [Valsa mali var. pyri (nom. inval.)]
MPNGEIRRAQRTIWTHAGMHGRQLALQIQLTDATHHEAWDHAVPLACSSSGEKRNLVRNVL